MNMKHNFKRLIIWQDSMDLCDLIDSYTETLPNKEKFNLISQLEKCGVSIPSNISEGSGKRTNKHFSEFLTTALTFSYEVETQLLICARRKYGNEKALSNLLERVNSLQSKIFSFREKIESENNKVKIKS
jgi:four helix bundle protein